jgi:regulator of cell morphogenesis and NO signaling
LAHFVAVAEAPTTTENPFFPKYKSLVFVALLMWAYLNFSQKSKRTGRPDKRLWCNFTLMENIAKKPVGQIVAEDFSTYSVFESHKIDYYNKGKRTLEGVAAEHAIDLTALISEIEKKKRSSSPKDEDFNSWPLDALYEHIIKTYHLSAEQQIKEIKPVLEKATGVYGAQYPVIPEIKKLFDEAAGIIAVHQKKEELILFPFIRKMADAKKNDKEFVTPRATKSVESPVDMLTHEHHQQSHLLQKIAELSHDYTSQGVDSTFQDSLRLLKEFELKLHQHLHLENNILFPKALKLEKELTA